jgi:hypothetical protein
MIKKTKNLITNNPWKVALIVVIIAVALWLWKPRATKIDPNQDFVANEIKV